MLALLVSLKSNLIM